MAEAQSVIEELRRRLPDIGITEQPARDETPTVWIDPDHIGGVLAYLKNEADSPYRMLYDLVLSCASPSDYSRGTFDGQLPSSIRKDVRFGRRPQ